MLSFYLKGLTPSGHPSKTTMGNTMRSILYTKFIADKAGVKIETLVSGDDVVIWCESRDSEKLVRAIRQYTVQDAKCRTPTGLGQIVKEIRVAQWWDFDFCSKYTWLNKDGHLGMCRDIEKALLTKRYWPKTCKVSALEWLTCMTASAIIEIPCDDLTDLWRARLKAYCESINVPMP